MSEHRLFNILQESKDFDSEFKLGSETIVVHEILKYEFNLFFYYNGHYMKEMGGRCGRKFFDGYEHAVRDAEKWSKHLGLTPDGPGEITVEIKVIKDTCQATGFKRKYSYEGGGFEPYEFEYKSICGRGYEEISTDTVWSSRDLEATNQKMGINFNHMRRKMGWSCEILCEKLQRLFDEIDGDHEDEVQQVKDAFDGVVLEVSGTYCLYSDDNKNFDDLSEEGEQLPTFYDGEMEAEG